MKKLFAISLILVIAASTAFAEVTVGGTAGYGVTVIKGYNSDGSVPKVGKAGPAGRIDAVYANDEGSFGALVRVQTIGDAGRIFAWWQPLSVLKLTLGKDGNGQYGREKIEGWSWTGAAGDEGVGYAGYQYAHNAWSAGGFGDFGATLSLTPITGLAINLMVPYEKSTEAEDVYKQIVGQLTYDFTDVGEIGVTYKSGAGYSTESIKGIAAEKGYYATVDSSGKITELHEWDSAYELGQNEISIKAPVAAVAPVEEAIKNGGAIYAHFYLTAIQNLQLNIGGKYTLGGTTEIAGVETTYAEPIKAGFGLNYNISDTIGVKAVLLASFLGSTKKGDVTTDDPFNLGFDLMPYFDLGILKLNLNMGVDYTDKREGTTPALSHDARFAWFVNPYITKSVGGGTFFAGFQLYSAYKDDEDKITGKVTKYTNDSTINWAVPIGLEISF
jgi:hypothetical protein